MEKNYETAVKLHIYFQRKMTEDEVHEELTKVLGKDTPFQVYEAELQEIPE